MKHILNEMSEEEKDSIRSQHTGTLKVQTERFKALVENKLGNAKPLISEQLDSFTAFESEDKNDYPKINLRKHFDKERELNPDLMGDDEWDDFTNDFKDEDIDIYDRKHFDKERELEEDSSDYRMYDLPEIHQSIEDEIEGMSDDEAIEFLKETIEFCEDKLNGYDFEDDLNEELADNEESIGNKLSILFKQKGKQMSNEMDVNEFAEEVVDICHGRSDYQYEKEWFFNGEVYGILRNIYELSEEDAVDLYIKILDDVDSKIHNDDTLNEQSTEDVNKGKKTGCYTVKSGDTVLAIANKFGITLDDVRALNGMTSTNSITPGQKLRVKNGTKFIGC